MKRIIFWLMVLFPTFLFAQESYWKVERVKPVMQTGLVFEAALGEMSNADYVIYDEAKKQVWYYSNNHAMEPYLLGKSLIKAKGKPVNESRIRTKIVGAELKILIYQDNNNIAFLACKKAADNKAAFLDKVNANKKK